MSLETRLSALRKNAAQKSVKKEITRASKQITQAPESPEPTTSETQIQNREESPLQRATVRILPPSAEQPAKIRKYAQGIVVEVRKELVKRKQDPTSITLLSGGVNSSVKNWISTGFPELDYISGGGLAEGRISEWFGKEGVGKSANVHRAIKSVQLQGGFAEIYDFEHSLDEEKMAQQEIDPDRLIYHDPDCIEEAQDVLSASLTKYIAHPPGCPILIAFDSVAAMPTISEMESSAKDNPNIAAQARAIRKLLRNVSLRLAKARVHLMFVNQLTADIGGYSPNPMFKPQTTPGGTGLRFWGSLRVRNTKIETIKDGTKATGYVIRTETQKCKLAPPHQRAEWVLDFKYGPSPELTLFRTLQQARLIKGSEPVYSVPFLDRTFSRYGWIEILKTDMAARQKAAELAVDVVAGTQVEQLNDDDGE